MNDMTRNAICIIVGYIVLWYAGAMFNFFPFVFDNGEVGFTGLLIVITIVICTCWIIDTIQKKDN